ncbi:HIT-like domain-containing protein [Scheffersomyces amazonensis]|uniref:HIT-like domain-containing protein n=1 Tax=Scheffersomyces amazonensis TaxID=1078765 RepID=UPI00315CF5FD
MSLKSSSDSSVYFYKFIVNHQVFFKSKYSYALVNLKPIVPGHVLVVPLRTSALRLADLSGPESIDYMNTLQLVHKFIETHYKADSLNIAIQDGPEAGQSVPHLHTHIIPRFATDNYGDAIYSKIEKLDLYSQFEVRRRSFVEASTNGSKLVVKADEDRIPRTDEVMKSEADRLRAEIGKYITENNIQVDI